MPEGMCHIPSYDIPVVGIIHILAILVNLHEHLIVFEVLRPLAVRVRIQGLKTKQKLIILYTNFERRDTRRHSMQKWIHNNNTNMIFECDIGPVSIILLFTRLNNHLIQKFFVHTPKAIRKIVLIKEYRQTQIYKL